MAAVDDTVPPATGAILVEPVRNNFRAIKGRIEDLPDALDPGGNQCTPLIGRAVVIGSTGAVPAQPSHTVSFGGAIVGGARIPQVTVTGNLSLTAEHCGALLVVTSGTDVVLTADLSALATGWACSVLRAGAGNVAVATTGGLTLRHPSGHTRVNATYDAVTLVRVGASDLVLLGATKP